MAEFSAAGLTAATPEEFAQMVRATPDQQIEQVLAGPDRPAILDAIFGAFPGRFIPARAQGVDARVDVRVTGGPDGSSDTYAVVVRDGVCSVERHPSTESTVSLMMGPVELVKIVTGSGNPVMMLMTGKLKVRGDLAVAQGFASWFDTPKM